MGLHEGNCWESVGFSNNNANFFWTKESQPFFRPFHLSLSLSLSISLSLCAREFEAVSSSDKLVSEEGKIEEKYAEY
jgi:hypothetical protein